MRFDDWRVNGCTNLKKTKHKTLKRFCMITLVPKRSLRNNGTQKSFEERVILYTILE